MNHPFNAEKFVEFKINTFNYLTETGGCIKCAFNYACGIDVSKEDYMVENKLYFHSAYDKNNWMRKEYGIGVALLLDKAEYMLQSMVLEITDEIHLPDILNSTQEAELKLFVIQGLKELGVIKESKTCVAV